MCTDGAPAMLGNKSGFSALVKQEISYLQVTLCFLHYYALESKTLPLKSKKVLDISVKTLNWIRCRAYHRLLSYFVKILDVKSHF